MVADAAMNDAIVRSAATGDEVAFARLVDEHHAAMARVAYVICGDPEITRDATQAAWVVAWRRIGSLREPSKVRPWLVAIAANETRRAVRRARRGGLVDISDAVADLHADPGDAVQLLDLGQAIGALDPDDRLLIALRYEAGLDSNEIAAQLGLSASGVRTRLSRVVDKLRARLTNPGEITS